MIHNIFDKEIFLLKSDPSTIHSLDDCSYISSGLDGNVYRFSKNLIVKIFYPETDIKYTLLKADKFCELSELNFDHYRFPQDLVFDDIGNFAGELSKYITHNEELFFKISKDEFLKNIDGIKKETKQLLSKGIIPNDVGFHNMLYQNKMKLIDPTRFILASSLSSKEKKEFLDRILNNFMFSIFSESLKKTGVSSSSASLYAYSIDDYMSYFAKNFKEDTFYEFLDQEKQKIIR